MNNNIISGKLHSVPSINGLPAFNLNLQVIANFLEEIKETEHFSHPFIMYVSFFSSLCLFLHYFLFLLFLSSWYLFNIFCNSVLKEACQTLQAVNNPILPSGIVCSSFSSVLFFLFFLILLFFYCLIFDFMLFVLSLAACGSIPRQCHF